MPTKAEQYARLAGQITLGLTETWQEWTGFLTTAARLYKYPFHEQMMIYAQRPDATACAEYDFWKTRMGRYVRRGSKGIALVDDSGARPRLRYVFDVSDTGARRNSRTPWLWKLEQQHIDPVADQLANAYGIDGQDVAQQLTEIAQLLARESWDRHRQALRDIVDQPAQTVYDEDTLKRQFQQAAANSIAYAVLSRCGLEPERTFQAADFAALQSFRTPGAIRALGVSVSRCSEQVLRQIEGAVKAYTREQLAERSTSNGHQPDLHPARGPSHPRPAAERTTGQAPGQVRPDAQSLPEGAAADFVQPAVAGRAAVSAPAGDRGGGEPPSGAAAAPAGRDSGRDRAVESPRPDAMGGADEHLQSPSRGSDSSGIDPQLSLFPDETDQVIDAGPSETPGPFSMLERRYQVVVYHHLENGFDEKLEYPTMEEAEKVAQSYVNGTMEQDGFVYDGAAVYDLQQRTYLRIFGTYPDEAAQAQVEPPDQSATHKGDTIATGSSEPKETTAPDGEREATQQVMPENFRITDDHLGEGGPKAKFRANMEAIHTLKTLETEGRTASAAEQEILSRYVGWGGLADAFDPSKASWASEYQALKPL